MYAFYRKGHAFEEARNQKMSAIERKEQYCETPEATISEAVVLGNWYIKHTLESIV